MRISDWSSDVCSSDLRRIFAATIWRRHPGWARFTLMSHQKDGYKATGFKYHCLTDAEFGVDAKRGLSIAGLRSRQSTGGWDSRNGATGQRGARQYHPRSEEHTSELQSLMRISYAVF